MPSLDGINFETSVPYYGNRTSKKWFPADFQAG